MKHPRSAFGASPSRGRHPRTGRAGSAVAAWLSLTLWVAPVLADDGIDAAAQRERITRERAQVEAEYRSEAARCAGQFSVTSCVERARVKRRTALERLDHERAVLDDMHRKR